MLSIGIVTCIYQIPKAIQNQIVVLINIIIIVINKDNH